MNITFPVKSFLTFTTHLVSDMRSIFIEIRIYMTHRTFGIGVDCGLVLVNSVLIDAPIFHSDLVMLCHWCQVTVGGVSDRMDVYVLGSFIVFVVATVGVKTMLVVVING